MRPVFLPLSVLTSVAFLLVPLRGNGHGLDQSYIFMKVLKDGLEGTFEVTVLDLNDILNTSLPDQCTAQDLAPHLDQIHAYYRSHVSFQNGNKTYPLTFTGVDFLDLEFGYFIHFGFRLEQVDTVPEQIQIDYNAFIAEFPEHRAFLVELYNWKAGIHQNEANIKARFSPNNTSQTYELTTGSVWTGFATMVQSGMWHIWIGLDHILFIVALLLPAVMVRDKRTAIASLWTTGASWSPVDRFRPAFIYVLKIVTLFTVGHTITLSLAALGLISLPSWLVESLIALSIGLAAFHNIKPFIKNEPLIIAFGFGLFHGFGFASVLGDVGLQGDYLIYSLLGFNVGVEICQVLLICAIFPVLFFLRNSVYYRGLLIYGSILLIIISIYWFTERAFGLEWQVDEHLGNIFRYK